MNAQALVNRTEAWIQEELCAQKRMLGLLGEQEQAIRAADAERVLASGARIEAELAGGAPRERRRRDLVNTCARAFGVTCKEVTLTALGERAREAGADVSRLEIARGELRSTTAAVLRKGRKISAQARYHQGLLEELALVLAGPSAGAPPGALQRSATNLIDAEA